MKLSLSIPGTNGTPVQIDSDLPSGVPTGGFDPTGYSSIRAFIILIVIAAIFFALATIMRGGWDLIQSRGHKESVQRAREKILYALFGLVMVFLSFSIIGLFASFFRINLLPFLKWK